MMHKDTHKGSNNSINTNNTSSSNNTNDVHIKVPHTTISSEDTNILIPINDHSSFQGGVGVTMDSSNATPMVITSSSSPSPSQVSTGSLILNILNKSLSELTQRDGEKIGMLFMGRGDYGTLVLVDTEGTINNLKVEDRVKKVFQNIKALTELQNTTPTFNVAKTIVLIVNNKVTWR